MSAEKLMTRAAPIQWGPRMRQRGGKVAHYLGVCALTGKHRCQTSNKYTEYNAEARDDAYTVWLVDDAGVCRGDRQPCDQDIVGPAA